MRLPISPAAALALDTMNFIHGCIHHMMDKNHIFLDMGMLVLLRA